MQKLHEACEETKESSDAAKAKACNPKKRKRKSPQPTHHSDPDDSKKIASPKRVKDSIHDDSQTSARTVSEVGQNGTYGKPKSPVAFTLPSDSARAHSQAKSRVLSKSKVLKEPGRKGNYPDLPFKLWPWQKDPDSPYFRDGETPLSFMDVNRVGGLALPERTDCETGCELDIIERMRMYHFPRMSILPN